MTQKDSKEIESIRQEIEREHEAIRLATHLSNAKLGVLYRRIEAVIRADAAVMAEMEFERKARL